MKQTILTVSKQLGLFATPQPQCDPVGFACRLYPANLIAVCHIGEQFFHYHAAFQSGILSLGRLNQYHRELFVLNPVVQSNHQTANRIPSSL